MSFHFERPDKLHDPLYVMCVMFNPMRWRSRWKLYQDFIKRVREAGAIPVKVEIAFGNRDFVVTGHPEPGDIELQLRTSDPIWLKENALNIAVQRLPFNWKYMAWIDTDIAFARDDWANEIIHQLQHFPVVQVFSEAHELNSKHEVIETYKSFGYCWNKAIFTDTNINHPVFADGETIDPPEYNTPYAMRTADMASPAKAMYRHPGYGWACTKWAFEAVGGLLDICVLGAGDYHMAYAILGKTDVTISHNSKEKGYNQHYVDAIYKWQVRAEKLGKRLGYVDGAIFHAWHGSKPKRKYNSRWKTLVDCNFDPTVDIYRDYQGLWQLAPHANPLRAAMYDYMLDRDEDSPN